MKRVDGIYLIKNMVTLRVRVGSAKDVYKRFSNYKARLRGGKANKLMQEDYNEYGEQSFEFVLLEECLVRDLYLKEAYYLELYAGCASYNKNAIKNLEKKIRRGKEAKNYKEKRSKVTSGTNNGHNTKLVPNDVLEIRDLLLTGLSLKSIANKFDVSQTLIYNIKAGKRWASV